MVGAHWDQGRREAGASATERVLRFFILFPFFFGLFGLLTVFLFCFSYIFVFATASHAVIRTYVHRDHIETIRCTFHRFNREYICCLLLLLLDEYSSFFFYYFTFGRRRRRFIIIIIAI